MKHKFKIFVIDDNPGFTMALQIHLEKKGHDVITFNKATDFPLDGNNLCPCSKGTTCGDFLIIDQQMPDINGLDFIHLLSQSGCKGILRNTLLMSGWKKRVKPANLDARCYINPLNLMKS